MPKKFVRVCPKCRSMDVSHDMSVEAIARGSVFNNFKCNKCGYTGIFFPEIKEMGKARKRKKR
jgi:predicted nucleic-acid-binding Zn-ribbon protein